MNQLPHQDATVFRRRQAALADRLAGNPGLLFAGGPRARNYTANTYPFRASSHFLYLTGASLPGAALLMGPRGAELFVEPDGPDSALWYGAVPGMDEIRDRTGAACIRPLRELAAAVASLGGGEQVASLPSPDPHTRAEQRRLLGRSWPEERPPDVTELGEVDLRLADAMIDLRLRHDTAAVDAIRAAAAVTREAFKAGMAATRPGLHERDVRAAMEREIIRGGGECAYTSIVTVNGHVLHNECHANPIAAGDLLLADVGAELHGWASDVTRTWPVSGRFSSTQRALYDLVLAAQTEAIAMVRPGVRYRDIHLGASLVLARGLVDEGILRGDPESLVERGVHAALFPHGVGHLLGLDVHDMEDLWDRAGYAPGRTRSKQFGLGYLRLDRDLEPGMIFTIEPGLYVVPAILDDPRIAGPFLADGSLDRKQLERFADVRGIRIEDDVLCTQAGHEVLTPGIPKRAEDVEACIGIGG